MFDSINSLCGKDAFHRTLANGEAKNDVENYRATVKFFADTNVKHHTNQLKSEKALKVVMRGCHHAVDATYHKEEIKPLGFEVRKVTNIISHKDKILLRLFFVG